MRLIDADAVELGFDELCRSPYFKHDVNAKHGAETLMDVCVRTDSHMPNTIDPETLPIVRQLRAELARVTAERDEVYCLPVKPGDKVYQQNGVDVYELEVKKIIFDCGHIAFDESAIGSSIHLTEEAANAALAKSVRP